MSARGDPPFRGTVHDIGTEIITSADATSLVGLQYAGRGIRTVFDRRPNDWIEVNAYLFDAEYDGGDLVEVQVNPEFGSRSSAAEQAQFYATAIGRLPRGLRTEVRTIWIHRGGPEHLLGGGNSNILIHTGEAKDLFGRGTLEEALLHEAAHTSLDPIYKDDARWLAAQTADGTFISTYARDHPDREDIAESVVPWIAVRYRRERIAPEVAETIIEKIPHRIAFFDSLNMDMRPMRGYHAIPLFMAAANTLQEGFMRVINHSGTAGTVRIEATDDAGQTPNPVTLALDAWSAVHLNSNDLESGNAAKGLPEGVGPGTGNWRLRLDTELLIEPLAYIRTPDGFVTSVHDLVVNHGAKHQVPIFNPGSNENQQSVLRVVNSGSERTAIEIVGYDDSGSRPSSGDVRLTLEPGTARMITAQELESGAHWFDGSLGDGHGKWRLFLHSDKPVQVMNLMQTPTGHLTNLSTSTSTIDYVPPPP